MSDPTAHRWQQQAIQAIRKAAMSSPDDEADRVVAVEGLEARLDSNSRKRGARCSSDLRPHRVGA